MELEMSHVIPYKESALILYHMPDLGAENIVRLKELKCCQTLVAEHVVRLK